MKRWITLTWVLAAVLMVVFAGCSREKYAMSPNVQFLWQQHPAPWSQTAAEAAAKDAKGLMDEHPKDFQLQLYYEDRMSSYDQDSLIAEYQAKLAKDSTDARMILLEARAVGGRNRTANQMRKALALAPDDPYVLAFTAKALIRSRPAQPDSAQQLASKAVEIAPNLAIAHQALAEADLTLQKPDAAVDESGKAMELDPYDFEPVYLHAVAMEQLEKGDEALAELEKYAKDHPADPQVVSVLEQRYRQRNELEKVAPMKRLAAQANPNDGWAYLDLAQLYMELGWKDSVYAALNEGIDAGFYDLDLTRTILGSSDDTSILKGKKFAAIQARMEKMREDTKEERRKEALADPINTPAPAFTAKTLGGKEVSLADLRGKVVVLDFWATWCGPCRMTIPRVREFYDSKPDAEIVSMNVWERMPADQRPAQVAQFAKKEGMKWNVWLAENQTADDYQVLGIPTFLVIDKDGTIRYKVVGYQPFLNDVLGWMVEAAHQPIMTADAH